MPKRSQSVLKLSSDSLAREMKWIRSSIGLTSFQCTGYLQPKPYTGKHRHRRTRSEVSPRDPVHFVTHAPGPNRHEVARYRHRASSLSRENASRAVRIASEERRP